MSSSDTKTERVQLTLPCSLVNQCRDIAESSGLTLSKVLEHFARSGVQQGLTLTFSPNSVVASPVSGRSGSHHSAPNHGVVTTQHGSKPTTTQNPAEIDDSTSLEELLELPPR